MLHLMKLAVGVRDLAHLRSLQAARLRTDPPLRHRTRSFPRRAPELLAGGSIYWVIGGAMIVRQRLTAIAPAEAPDGSKAAALVFDPTLVPIEPRFVKPFQGWRYLEPTAAPRDLAPRRAGRGEARLPERLRLALAELCLP
ncbi:MAG: DUF1489 family protein [Acetobacteraceae bacterium]